MIMADEKETLTLTLHGLPAFNKDVDGEVFARKFFKFMQALAEADIQANGERKSKFLIDDLVKNTATAKVREQPMENIATHLSSVRYFTEAAANIYYDRPAARSLSTKFVGYLKEVATGTGETFQLGEIKFGNDNILRIDDGFRKNTDKIAKEIQRLSKGKVEPFAGQARISLDGTIKALDSRKREDLAVIELTAGNRQIECHVDQIPDGELVKFYKTRCNVHGIGHYTGNDGLPDWVQVIKIEPVLSDGIWDDWKGAFPELKADGWN
jgi:hypothetical protein